MNILKVENPEGKYFIVRKILCGEGYGVNDSIIHDREDPLIEFFDFDYANVRSFGEYGQFISRYYESTLAERTPYALSLYSDVDSWYLSKENMYEVLEWLGYL